MLDPLKFAADSHPDWLESLRRAAVRLNLRAAFTADNRAFTVEIHEPDDAFRLGAATMAEFEKIRRRRAARR